MLTGSKIYIVTILRWFKYSHGMNFKKKKNTVP